MLLKTIGGKYADSFNRWKTIPEKSELGHIPQVSRFFVNLCYIIKITRYPYKEPKIVL